MFFVFSQQFSVWGKGPRKPTANIWTYTILVSLEPFPPMKVLLVGFLLIFSEEFYSMPPFQPGIGQKCLEQLAVP